MIFLKRIGLHSNIKWLLDINSILNSLKNYWGFLVKLLFLTFNADKISG